MRRYRPARSEIRKHAVASSHCDLGIGERISLHVDVGQDPIAVNRLPRKGSREREAHNAICAVASVPPDHTAIRAAKRRLHAVASNCERCGLHAALHREAAALKPFLKQALVSACGRMSAQGVWLAPESMRTWPTTAPSHNVDAVDLESRFDEWRRPSISEIQSSSVRLQTTMAFDLSVRCAALSTIRTGIR